MKTHTLYDNQGKVMAVVTSSDDEIPTSDQFFVIEGALDYNQYVKDGQIKTQGADPSNGMIKYKFNHASEAWTIDHAATQKNCRDFRNQLLATVDKINGVWYANLTAEQQQELSAYRQALLDVPQQAGFPTDTSWPAKPTWL